MGKFILTINVALGLGLWFGYITDLSLAGTLPDLLVPPVVGVIAFLSWRVLRRGPDINGWIYQLACLPALIGGCLPGLLLTILVLPPFTLGFLLILDEMSSESQLQRTLSPDGSRIAEVYYTGARPYGSGRGRIFVRVKRSHFPWIERDIYHQVHTPPLADAGDYLHWIDSDTLYLSEQTTTVPVGPIQFDTPFFLRIFLFMVRDAAAAKEP